MEECESKSGVKKTFMIDKGFILKEDDDQQIISEISVMDNGYYLNQDKITSLEKGRLLVNGAILKFNWDCWKSTRDKLCGFQISAQHVKGPFGVIVNVEET